MASLNKIMLIGNVGKDPEVRTLQGGAKVARFTLATSRKMQGNDGAAVIETTWHSVTCWNKQADVVEKYVTKGMSLYVEGELRQHQYAGQDGQQKTYYEVSANTIQMLSGREQQSAPQQSQQSYQQSAPQMYQQRPVQQQRAPQQPAPSGNPFGQAAPAGGFDDMPF